MSQIQRGLVVLVGICRSDVAKDSRKNKSTPYIQPYIHAQWYTHTHASILSTPTHIHTLHTIEYIIRKILNTRLFEDDAGKPWNKSVVQKNYEVLVGTTTHHYITPHHHYTVTPTSHQHNINHKMLLQTTFTNTRTRTHTTPHSTHLIHIHTCCIQ